MAQQTKKPTKTVSTAKAKAKAAFAFDYGAQVADVERKFSIGAGSMALEAKRSSCVSTGLLGTDLMLGGGIYGGCWYTVFGAEQSAKTTHLMHMSQGIIRAGVPVVSHDDFEGTLAPDYYEAMMLMSSRGLKFKDVFGVQDPDGNYVIEPKIRKYEPDTAEQFFNRAASLLRRLPDKRFIKGTWFYVFDNTKQNRAIVGNNYSSALYSKYNQFFVEAPDGMPQAVFFLDSYPAMFPDRLDEDDAGSGMAAIARMFSENIPKVLPKLKPKNAVIIGVNQLRLRPGFNMGCLHYDSVIHFVDGRKLPIGEVVANKVQGKVWAYNEATDSLVARSIINWFDNGENTERSWVTVKTQGVGTKNGISSLKLTANHKVLTRDRGWVEAAKLTNRDWVCTKYVSSFNGTRRNFLSAAITHDAAFMWDSKTINSAIRFSDSTDPAYVQWKLQKLGGEWFRNICRIKTGNYTSFTSQRTPEYEILRKRTEGRDPTKVAKWFTTMSFAVAYMDDGHLDRALGRITLSYKRFKNQSQHMISIKAMWDDHFGTDGTISKDGALRFTAADSKRILTKLARYIPPCMYRKLPESLRGRYVDYSLTNVEKVKTIWAQVLSVEAGGDKLYSKKTTKKYRHKYDIQVEGLSNYLAGSMDNGFIVHNSPEYEPAGEAVRFASAVRIRQAARSVPHGKGPIEEEKSVFGDGIDRYRYVHMKAIKNKVTTPYLEAWQRVWVADADGQGRGFDPVWDTFAYLKNTGQLAGNMKKIKLPEILPKSVLTWQEFKSLILVTDKAARAKLLKSLKLKTDVNIRQICQKQLKTGTAFPMFFDTLKKHSSEDDE